MRSKKSALLSLQKPMNKAGKILASGLAGTAFMTLFSYGASRVEKENFSEPEHLGKMLQRLEPDTSKQFNYIAGWLAHFGVGIAFATAYIQLWDKHKLKPSVKNTLALGTLSGALAVLIWKATFKAHPSPPWVSFKKYYTQLIGAHIVFALFAVLAYRLAEDKTAIEKVA